MTREMVLEVDGSTDFKAAMQSGDEGDPVPGYWPGDRIAQVAAYRTAFLFCTGKSSK
jgi:hypothetical protein